jgi:hypothetical protein
MQVLASPSKREHDKMWGGTGDLYGNTVAGIWRTPHFVMLPRMAAFECFWRVGVRQPLPPGATHPHKCQQPVSGKVSATRASGIEKQSTQFKARLKGFEGFCYQVRARARGIVRDYKKGISAQIRVGSRARAFDKLKNNSMPGLPA